MTLKKLRVPSVFPLSSQAQEALTASICGLITLAFVDCAFLLLSAPGATPLSVCACVRGKCVARVRARFRERIHVHVSMSMFVCVRGRVCDHSYACTCGCGSGICARMRVWVSGCASPHIGSSGMQTHTNSFSVPDYSLATMAASPAALPGTAGRDTGELHGEAMHWQGLLVAQSIIMLLVYLLHVRHTR